MDRPTVSWGSNETRTIDPNPHPSAPPSAPPSTPPQMDMMAAMMAQMQVSMLTVEEGHVSLR